MAKPKLVAHEHYNNVSDLWAESLAPIPEIDSHNLNLQNYVASGLVGRGSEWMGLPTVADVIATRVTGWIAGADRVQAFTDTIKANIPTPQSIRRRIKWADQGDMLDIHRVWAGRLGEAWESHPRQARSGQQTVTLFAQLWQHAGSSTESFFWRGAATLALSDLLSEAGYNVTILGGSLTYNVLSEDCRNENVRAFTVTIKEPMAQLDKASLAATISLSGFCRIGIFSLFTRYAHRMGKECYSCFGILLHSDVEAYTHVQKQLKDKHGFAWDFDSTQVNDKESAEAWIKASIATLQGTDT